MQNTQMGDPMSERLVEGTVNFIRMYCWSPIIRSLIAIVQQRLKFQPVALGISFVGKCTMNKHADSLAKHVFIFRFCLGVDGNTITMTYTSILRRNARVDPCWSLVQKSSGRTDFRERKILGVLPSAQNKKFGINLRMIGKRSSQQWLEPNYSYFQWTLSYLDRAASEWAVPRIADRALNIQQRISYPYCVSIATLDEGSFATQRTAPIAPASLGHSGASREINCFFLHHECSFVEKFWRSFRRRGSRILRVVMGEILSLPNDNKCVTGAVFILPYPTPHRPIKNQFSFFAWHIQAIFPDNDIKMVSKPAYCFIIIPATGECNHACTAHIRTINKDRCNALEDQERSATGWKLNAQES